MASQKRKHPYEEASAAGPAPRRATRHSAGASTTSAEPEKQRRSGRGRANTLEGLHDTIAGPNDAEAQRKDAPKSKATPAPPAAAPLKTTRTSRGHTAEPEAEASIVVRSGKPQEKKRSAQPKATTRQPVVLPVAPSALKAEEKIQANTSRARTYVPPPKPQRQVYPQVPATSLTDPASVSSITPKRRASGAIAQPPPTPKADRNIDKVVLGNICFKTWYPSYYNKEVLGDASGNLGAQSNGGSAKIGGGKKEKEALLDRLYVCPSCFKYSKELVSWTRHVKYCQSQSHVPGTKVYTHPKNSIIAQRHPKSNDAVHADEGEWSVWEVDGERDALFCQNLSLFAKLFLDNKSVFFDVTGFTYFLLVYTPSPDPTTGGMSARNICGFFSKEKMSWDNNNLACILVFPPWQRKGLGALLMGVSYEISKREGTMGGPEKPISELGRKGYKRYWAGEIARWLLSLELSSEAKSDEGEELLVDVEEVSKATWVVQEDCLAILREMDLVQEIGLGPSRPKEVLSQDGEMTEQVVDVPRVKLDKNALRRWVKDNNVNLQRVCDPDGFIEGYAFPTDQVEEEDL